MDSLADGLENDCDAGPNPPCALDKECTGSHPNVLAAAVEPWHLLGLFHCCSSPTVIVACPLETLRVALACVLILLTTGLDSHTVTSAAQA